MNYAKIFGGAFEIPNVQEQGIAQKIFGGAFEILNVQEKGIAQKSFGGAFEIPNGQEQGIAQKIWLQSQRILKGISKKSRSPQTSPVISFMFHSSQNATCLLESQRIP